MSATSWYVLDGPTSLGPFTELELLRRFFQGACKPEDLVWSDEDQTWRSLKSAFPLDKLTPPPLPVHLEEAISSANTSNLPQNSEGAWPSFGKSPEPLLLNGWAAEPHYRWRRYFARQVDYLVLGFLICAAIGLILTAYGFDVDALLGGPSAKLKSLALGAFACFLSVVPNGLLLGLTGRTIGKSIFGLKVTRGDGAPIGLSTALRREVDVFVSGAGLGIPIISFFCDAKCLWETARL